MNDVPRRGMLVELVARGVGAGEGVDPWAQYRDLSATALLIQEGRDEVAEVLARSAGTAQELMPGQPPDPSTFPPNSPVP
jgi:hypothetical protein